MDEQQVKSVTPATDSNGNEMSEEERQRRMDQLREVIERIGERNRHLHPEVELAFITEVVEEVRQERYEREQRQTENSR